MKEGVCGWKKDGWRGYYKKKKNNCNLTLHDNDLPKKHWVDETWMDGEAIKHKSCSDLTYYMMIAYWRRSVGWIKMDEQRGK